MPQIHAQCWGTPDAWWYDHRTQTLYVWDLKYGHLSVMASGNYQMAAYILGILNIIKGDDALGDNGIKIVATIVQPRCYDGQGVFRRWELDSKVLEPYIRVMEKACTRSQTEGATVNAGRHCRDCLGRKAYDNAYDGNSDQ